jgi:hypothetical protein
VKVNEKPAFLSLKKGGFALKFMGLRGQDKG